MVPAHRGRSGGAGARVVDNERVVSGALRKVKLNRIDGSLWSDGQLVEGVVEGNSATIS